MEIRQLKYFLSVAECGSFTEASRRCYLSQSALSQQIKALEDELKTRLLERTPHHVVLTESGRELLPLARQVLQSVDDCRLRMSELGDMLCGVLNLGLTPSLEPYVRRAMLRFMKLHPKVLLNVWYKTIPELMTMLREGALDVAFTIKGDEEEWLESTALMSYRLCAFMRDTHPLANRERLSLKDLRGQPLILPERALRLRNALEDYLGLETDGLLVRASVNDPAAILNLVRSSNCITILSERTAGDCDELHVVTIDELSQPVMNYAHMLRGSHHKRSALEFVRLTSQVTREYGQW